MANLDSAYVTFANQIKGDTMKDRNNGCDHIFTVMNSFENDGAFENDPAQQGSFGKSKDIQCIKCGYNRYVDVNKGNPNCEHRMRNLRHYLDGQFDVACDMCGKNC
jgi:hypothetical protein